MAKNVPGTRAFSSFEEAEDFFAKASLGEQDIFVTMGAGEAYKIGDYMLKG